MPITSLNKTWFCLECGYHLPVAIDPFGDYYTQQYLGGIEPGMCASCFTNPNPDMKKNAKLELANDLSDPAMLISTNTSTDTELESRQVEDTDSNGQPLTVESGKVTYELNSDTGQIVPTPVMVPKMRSLTNDELAALKLQRDQTLDSLQPNVIQEVTPV
jgi:hypothetical protein